MSKIINIASVCMLVTATALAQTAPQGPPAGKLPVRSLLQSMIEDALNKRLQAPPVGQQLSDRSNGSVLDNLHMPVKQQFYDYVGNSFGTQQLARVKKGMGVVKDPAKYQRYIDDKLRGFYALRNDNTIFPILKQGAYKNSVKGATVQSFYDNNPGNPAVGGINLRFDDQVMLNNIPVNISYSNISGYNIQDNGLINQPLMKGSFDKEAYVKRLTGTVEKKYDLKKYFLQDIDVKAATKSFAEKRMKDIQENVLPAGFSEQFANFNAAFKADHLIQLDDKQIRAMLLDNGRLGLTEADLDAVTGVSQDNLLASGSVTDLRQLERLKMAKASREYLTRIYQLKSDITEGLEAKSVISSQNAAGRKVGEMMDNEEDKKRNIKQLLPLNFLQKLLLDAKRVDIGTFAANGSKGGVQDLFMSGAQSSFLNKGKFLMLGAGKRMDGGMIRDKGFNSSVDPGAYSLQFLQMGKGDIDAAHSHVALVNARTKTDSRRQYQNISLPRNTFVGAFSEEINAGKYGKVSAQFSKSSTQFDNSAVGNEAALASKTAAFALFNDFWQTVSVGLDYNGTVEEWRLAQRAYISYSGLGYNNPASPGSGRGTVRYGLKLKRTWHKNKLALGMRTDFQDISSSALTNSKWRNRQIALDGRWKLNRRVSFDGRLNQSVMKNMNDKQVLTRFLTRQASLGSQINGRMMSLPYNSNGTFGLQQLEMGDQQSMLLNLSVNHNLMVNTHVLSVNLFYNKDIRNMAVYADLFTVESSWSYQVLEKINCSSGITYLDNKAVVRQVGFKQTLNTQILRKLNVNAFIDCREHLYNSSANYLFGNFRGELSLSYLLN